MNVKMKFIGCATCAALSVVTQASVSDDDIIAYFPFDSNYLSVVNAESNPQAPVLYLGSSGQVSFVSDSLPGKVIVANGRGRTNGGCLLVDQSRVYLDLSGFETGETMVSATLEFFFRSASTVDWGCKVGLMRARATSISDSERPLLFSLQRNSAGQMQARADSVNHDGTDVHGVNYVYFKGSAFDNEWHHLAMTIEPRYSDQNVHTGSAVTFYIDSISVGSATMSNPWRGFAPDGDSKLYLTIGESSSCVSVDEVRLSKGCLAKEDFLSKRETPVPSIGDALAYFPFEQSLASVAPCDAKDKPYLKNANDVTVLYSDNVGRDSISTYDLTQVINEENRHCLDVRMIYQFAMPYWALGAESMDSATIEFFAKGGSMSANWMTLLKVGCSDQPVQFLVQLNSGTPRLFTFRADGWSSMQDFESVNCIVPAEKGTFADGRWHHFAMTAEPCGGGRSTIKFYFDHKLVHQQDTGTHLWRGLDPSTMYLYMGRKDCDFLIDEVRITKGALSVDKMLRFSPRGLLMVVH